MKTNPSNFGCSQRQCSNNLLSFRGSAASQKRSGSSRAQSATPQPDTASTAPPPDATVDQAAPATERKDDTAAAERLSEIISNVHLPDPGDVGMELVPPEVQLEPINSSMMAWEEDELRFSWFQVYARDNLLAMRNFLQKGMDLKIMEEKVGRSFVVCSSLQASNYCVSVSVQVLSYPVEPEPSEAGSPDVKGKKDAKKDAKASTSLFLI